MQSLFDSMKDPLSIVTDYGFILSDEGIQLVNTMDSKQKQNPVAHLLNTHIQKYSKAVLSPDLNSATTTLSGKFILQIVNITNISAPSINQSSTLFPRMLKVRLTDGTTYIHGIEYESVSQLQLNTPPGTKVLVTNPEFYNGRLLLRPTQIKVLGGIVQEVYDLWKSQEMMAMQNRYRRNIRDASLNPPKFISFADFISQRRKPVSKPSNAKQPSKPVSQTAGVLPEVKKVEELDLGKITDLRKEALQGIDGSSVREMGKWGSNKLVEKATEPPPRRNQTRPPRTEKPVSLPTRTMEPGKRLIETKREAVLMGMTHDLSTREIICMLKCDKSIMMFPVTSRLYSYLLACSDDGMSVQGIKDELIDETYVFGIVTENGHEAIASLTEDEMVIPPDDFVVSDVKKDVSNPPSRAFFKSRSRGRGGRRGSNRGRSQPRGGHFRGRGRH